MAEKSLNDLPRDVRALYQKGNEALTRENIDYAIDLFNQVLVREPGFYECRKALRIAQLRRSGSSGGGFFKRMLSGASSSPLIAKGQMALHKDAAEALQIAEQVLNSDPNSSAAHKLIVEAATTLQMPRTAVLSLELLAKFSPRDKEVAIKLANALAEIGEAPHGERILIEICRLFPRDGELAQALKDISARKTLDEGGYEALADGSGSYRDILKDKEEAISLEQQNRQVKTEDVAARLIREYEARLPKEPNNLKLLRTLAELYTQQGQFDAALGYYERIRQSGAGSDALVDRAIAETVARKYDYQISQLDAAAPDYAERSAALQAEKQAYQLAECQKRVERFPTDLQFRFELGELYLQAGKIGEAIQEFQKAQNNPHKRIAAMNYLGQCFAKRKATCDMAVRTFQNALKEKPVFDEEKKELIYNLGCVLEAMGKKQEAIEQLKLIYEVDIGYKDVMAKVDASASGQG
jgi:tetratricopeptide (TPR) repeat protein